MRYLTRPSATQNKTKTMKTYEIFHNGKMVAVITALCSDFARLSFVESNPSKIRLENVKAVEVAG